ncbi:IucA/IucC family protein [Paenibacillus chartarius]|uniref:IucA/IucC family protein n=1 Tax=Paenibacillus chartarius TaxID=747481 RepID=A0ABV6DT30_9BACL
MLHNYEPALAAPLAGRQQAEQAALRGLLNCYLRETGVFDPRLPDGRTLPGFIRQSAGEIPFVILLPATGARIAGTLAYYSMTGQHDYGERFYAAYADENDDAYALLDAGQLIDLLLAEVSFREPAGLRSNRRAEMREQIGISIRRTAKYIASRSERADIAPADGSPLSYIRSEQSLILGHPFHPTPKSSEGFTDRELEQYAPEMGGAFPLHYMAVAREWVREEWVGERGEVPAEVRGQALKRLGARAGEYELLPLHPWQKRYVCGQAAVKELLGRGDLVDLGAIGPVVYPTSSVRTVWEPAAAMFYKLPLHVRITNFIRENTVEQVRRTMDAARVLQRALEQRQAAGDGLGGMCILRETGYRTVAIPGAGAAERERLMASFAVVYRPASELDEEERTRCFVVASLLEESGDSGEPLLFRAVRQSSGGRLPDWQEWLAAYLQRSMLPLLRFFAETGISLEAHVQNSLVSLENGLPARYYVRDLEGVSVHSGKAAALGYTPQTVPADSPVLYSGAEAWKRLKYYFVVNHLSALIHCIAKYSRTEEAYCWRTVRRLLHAERGQCLINGTKEELSGYIYDLLTAPVLPAKANFVSRFQGRGETPDFVTIPNPIVDCEVTQ